MNKVYYTDQHIKAFVQKIIFNMNTDGFKPDYVVGLTRGGLIPAVLLSEYTEIPMQTLKVSLRDNPETESNCWMGLYAMRFITARCPSKIQSEKLSAHHSFEGVCVHQHSILVLLTIRICFLFHSISLGIYIFACVIGMDSRDSRIVAIVG